jgi:uncharacterized protein YukJ
MVPLPFNVPGPDIDLSEKIDYHIQSVLAEKARRFMPLTSDGDRKATHMR